MIEREKMVSSARGRNRSALSVPSCPVTVLQSELSEPPKKMNFLLLLRTLRPGILLLRCLSGPISTTTRGRNRSAFSVPSCLVTVLQSGCSEQPKKMIFLLPLRTLRPEILLLRCLSGLLSHAAKHHRYDTGRYGGRH